MDSRRVSRSSTPSSSGSPQGSLDSECGSFPQVVDIEAGSFWARPKKEPGWVVSIFKDDVLINTASQARDHLANERTFLAWVRTVLALISTRHLVVVSSPQS